MDSQHKIAELTEQAITQSEYAGVKKMAVLDLMVRVEVNGQDYYLPIANQGWKIIEGEKDHKTALNYNKTRRVANMELAGERNSQWPLWSKNQPFALTDSSFDFGANGMHVVDELEWRKMLTDVKQREALGIDEEMAEVLWQKTRADEKENSGWRKLGLGQMMTGLMALMAREEKIDYFCNQGARNNISSKIVEKFGIFDSQKPRIFEPTIEAEWSTIEEQVGKFVVSSEEQENYYAYQQQEKEKQKRDAEAELAEYWRGVLERQAEKEGNKKDENENHGQEKKLKEEEKTSSLEFENGLKEKDGFLKAAIDWKKVKEKLKKMGKMVASFSGMSVGVFTVAAGTSLFGLSPVAASLLMGGGVVSAYLNARWLQDSMFENYIKDSIFILVKDKKKKSKKSVNSEIDQIDYKIAQDPISPQVLKAILTSTDKKNDFFRQQAFKTFKQLKSHDENGKEIVYGMESQALTYYLLKKMAKLGYIKDLKQEKIGEKKLIVEKVTMGNLKSLRDLNKKHTVLRMSFKIGKPVEENLQI